MRKSWIYVDGVAIEKGDYTPDHHYVMPDIQPYTSMLTGELITSRSRHREHLRERGYVEVADMVVRQPWDDDVPVHPDPR